jgi:hypothetical protein
VILGRTFWIWVWYGILLLGVIGLASALSWARHAAWRNLDEVLRAVGTITVSLGMLALLHGVRGGVGQVLLLVALAAFVLAFALGRKLDDRSPAEGDDEA